VDKIENELLSQRAANFSTYSELPGFWTFSIVRYYKKTGKHNISETGSVSIPR
jgi:hypothetical protein